jgi:hypothetical protein
VDPARTSTRLHAYILTLSASIVTNVWQRVAGSCASTFACINAVLQMKVRDYFVQGRLSNTTTCGARLISIARIPRPENRLLKRFSIATCQCQFFVISPLRQRVPQYGTFSPSCMSSYPGSAWKR